MITATDIARICHETNRAYCEALGDLSQQPWDEAQQWQRDSAIVGVEFRLANPSAPASAQHDAWAETKRKEGWVYGPTKDAVSRTHPCLVPFDQLPLAQQAKDSLFSAVVDALKPLLQ